MSGIRKNYHPLSTCCKCKRENVRIAARKRCVTCYRKYLEHTRSGYRARRLAYMREYQREQEPKGQLPSPLERVRLFCRVFRCSADDLLEYILWLRKENGPQHKTEIMGDVRTKHGYAHSTTRKGDQACTRRASSR